MFIRPFSTLSRNDVPLVGGKNSSLGELISQLQPKGIQVPDGFAITSDGYWNFLENAGFRQKLEESLSAIAANTSLLSKEGEKIRSLFLEASFPQQLAEEIASAYATLSRQSKTKQLAVAVRSSATAEDLPTASFAGQQETYLNVCGLDELLLACRKCYASLFTDRAISYRTMKGFDHMQVALSIGVQKMVRSDKGSSGVMFTLDTESGFPNAIVINAGWGLGENIVQGAITPDEFIVFKPLNTIIEKVLGNKTFTMVYAKGKEKGVQNKKTSKKLRESFSLEDQDILQLARWATLIEQHYGTPMDLEWAKDGITGELFIVQARPETVHSQKRGKVLKNYRLLEKGKQLVAGLAIGESIVTGKAQIIETIEQSEQFQEGSILVTKMTSPDWVPLMKKAAGIITDHGGRTSHAAIVSRELGVPAIVGTATATKTIPEGKAVTLCCAEGDQGSVYEGTLAFEEKEIDFSHAPQTKTDLMINLSGPAEAFHWWNLPCKGVGLARIEFIISNNIKIHPMALLYPEKVTNKKEQKLIYSLTKNYPRRADYFIDLLSQGIARIAASRYPHPVIVRLSDFKTNEYANLIGGKEFEPKEENPMLGFRGASRYYSPRYKEGFSLECQALIKARDQMGLTNIIPMIPFCRTLEEADRVLQVMAENGLKRGENGLKIYVMCEIPSNVLLAEEFADRFDGFSIGSNDLTQLTLGVDRDSEELSSLFDERNPAVKKLISQLIPAAHKKGCKVGICGQGPSDYPDFAEFLVNEGIDSISLNPDSVIPVLLRISALELKNTTKFLRDSSQVSFSSDAAPASQTQNRSDL